ncbi:MAG: hypothetical protein Q9202_004348 [Teloschistes flavicans]
MSLTSLPAPLTSPPTGRDLPYVTRVYIRAQIDQLRIPASLVASAYLDIGCGNGLTTLACTKKLLEVANAFGATVAVRVVDGLVKMVELTSRKIFSAAEDNPAFAGFGWKVGDVLGDASFLSTTIPQFEPPYLGTAQRVSLNVRVDQQARQLSQWFAALRPRSALILDVGHPQHDISAIFVGPGQVDQRAKRAVWHRCIQFCDDATFEECREHARRLAAETGLTITNTMPAQLPVATENGSTKYDIDPTLSGKAREKAKKIKEAARQEDENGNNGMGGADGASGASMSV